MIPAGKVTVKRRKVQVTDGILRLRLPVPAKAGVAYANLAYLAVSDTNVGLPALADIIELDALAAAKPESIAQPALAETPVELTPGTLVSLKSITGKASEPFQISDPDRPAMWCWYQDPRAVVDTANPEKPMLVTSVVTYGDSGTEQRGDIDLYWADLSTVGAEKLDRGRFELEDRLQMDDHAVPSLLIRPDGRYLATWALHGNHGSPTYPVKAYESVYMRTRISTNPHDPTSWQPLRREKVMDGAGLCYTHLYYLAQGNQGKPVVFNATRSIGFDSHTLYSDNLGESWRRGGYLMDAPDPWPDHGNGGRAYVKYAGDGEKRVYIIVTDDHPDVNFNSDRSARGPCLNSVYAGYIEEGKLFRMDGKVVDANQMDGKGTPPTELTVLLKDGTKLGENLMRRGWQHAIYTMPDGNPVATFQMRADDRQEDHRYFYARFDGEKFHVYFLAYGGANFGRNDQPDYTGLSAVDSMNPDVVYISTDAHPVTGAPLISSVTGQAQHEIWMGRTADSGKTWKWAAITENSPSDNLRPVCPVWEEGKSLVLWMQGNYPSFYVYDTALMGRIFKW